jgi:deazaflavin-dependent oxidoreductase (nitroreductase family)
VERVPKTVLRLIKLPPQVAYSLGLGPLVGRLILLLTTTGRKSGLPRVTPLQYEEADGVIYVGASLGARSDWVRNLQANPRAEVRLGRRRFAARAELVTDRGQIADYLELRLSRHPRMVGAILRSEGLPASPARSDLEEYAARLLVVALHPVSPPD